MNLTHQAVKLLLDGFAAHTRHALHIWTTTNELPQEHVAINLENDSRLHEHVEALENAGLIRTYENEDPMTRDVSPMIFQLTDYAILWCAWMLNQRALMRIPLTAPIKAKDAISDLLQRQCEELFS